MFHFHSFDNFADFSFLTLWLFSLPSTPNINAALWRLLSVKAAIKCLPVNSLGTLKCVKCFLKPAADHLYALLLRSASTSHFNPTQVLNYWWFSVRNTWNIFCWVIYKITERPWHQSCQVLMSGIWRFRFFPHPMWLNVWKASAAF